MRNARRRIIRGILAAIGLYVCWMAMLTLHEAGHVLHGLWSGGRVQRVTIPAIGFSETQLSVNPHPRFVAWGGAAWGCVLPLFALLAGWAWRRTRNAMLFFVGFCWIANGAYLAAGTALPGTDSADLARLGVSRVALAGAGAALLAGGLWCWHTASRPPRTGRIEEPTERQ